MARTYLYVLPGLMGSELEQVSASRPQPAVGWTADPPYSSASDRPRVWRRRVWIDEENFLNDRNRSLLTQLGGGAQGPVLPAGPLRGFYGPLLARLQRDAPTEWSVIGWGWDWRLSLQGQGVQLATFIRAQGAVDGGHRILGHSAGGLIARSAWLELKRTGDEGLISRVVTLGTPHWGTYAPALAWAEQDDLVDVVGLLAVGASILRRGTVGRMEALATAAVTFGSSITNAQQVQVRNVLELLTTWPSLYDLLPNPDPGDDEGDADRGAVFETRTWEAALRRPDSVLLWTAGENPVLGAPRSYQRSLHGTGVSQLPAGVLTCVAGTGTSTPRRIRRPPVRPAHPSAAAGTRLYRRDRLPTWENTTAGDGYVTTASALERGARHVLVEVGHGELVTDTTLLSRLVGLLTETVSEPPPPATVVRPTPTVVRPGVTSEALAMPSPLPAAPVPSVVSPPGAPATGGGQPSGGGHVPVRSQGSGGRRPVPVRHQ